VDVRIYEVLDAIQKISGQEKTILNKPDVVCNCPHCTGKAVHY
jgi:hypothetical protein